MINEKNWIGWPYMLVQDQGWWQIVGTDTTQRHLQAKNKVERYQICLLYGGGWEAAVVDLQEGKVIEKFKYSIFNPCSREEIEEFSFHIESEYGVKLEIDSKKYKTRKELNKHK